MMGSRVDQEKPENEALWNTVFNLRKVEIIKVWSFAAFEGAKFSNSQIGNFVQYRSLSSITANQFTKHFN